MFLSLKLGYLVKHTCISICRLVQVGLSSRIAQATTLSTQQTQGRRRVQQWTEDENLSRVVFSDDSMFKQNINSGKVRVWHPRGSICDPRYKMSALPGQRSGIMFWGCVGIHGVAELVGVTGILNAIRYQEVLDDNLFTSIDNIFGDRNVFFILHHPTLLTT